MNMATQSFGYGLAALLFCIAILGVCHKIKKAARKVLKSQQTHKDELPYGNHIDHLAVVPPVVPGADPPARHRCPSIFFLTSV